METNDNISDIQSLQPKTKLCNGKYTIEKKIGEGGFGITYKAVQIGLGRIVCIKEYFPAGKCIRNTQNNTVLLQGITNEIYEKHRNSFVREAQTLASLHHPNIVEVIDVFDENNTSYMVMPFIEGRSLQSIVTTEGKLAYPIAVNYMAQITNAVGYIHEKHLLHRDIKPDNIMITSDYKAILIDFGSARKFEQDKTQMHTSMLTHGYAPTEQYTSNSRKGEYTDIYAIGATLYFILTAQVPVEAAARLTEKMPEPKELSPEIPPEANRTILKAMQIKAENRHQTITEFMDDLRNIRPSKLIDESIGGENDKKKIKQIVIASISLLAIIITISILLINHIISDNNKNTATENKNKIITYDFIGNAKYPMVKVEGGKFTMGDTRNIAEEDKEEEYLAHSVYVDDFYIGQFEVSQELWYDIMGDNPSEYQPTHDDSGKEYSKQEKGKFPIENITYNEVQDFINKLNKSTGKQFSLPTEAEWEYAARGGRKSKGYNYSGTESPDNILFNRKHPSNIENKLSINEIGIHQMSGNVAEWCLDYYSETFYKKSKNSNNPINNTPNSDNSHVVRGGGHNDDDPQCVTVYYRDCLDGKKSKDYIGFRLVIRNTK